MYVYPYTYTFIYIADFFEGGGSRTLIFNCVLYMYIDV